MLASVPDLGLNGKERMTVDSLARAEVQRFADDNASDRMRGEMMGRSGRAGYFTEQMEELRSEDGQRRLHEGMKRFEGKVQDAIDKMMGGQGESRVRRSPMPHPPVGTEAVPILLAEAQKGYAVSKPHNESTLRARQRAAICLQSSGMTTRSMPSSSRHLARSGGRTGLRMLNLQFDLG